MSGILEMRNQSFHRVCVRRHMIMDSRNRSPYRTERVDLLAQNNIDWFSPHDIRRSVTKFLTYEGMAGGGSAILAHEVKSDDILSINSSAMERDDFQREHSARITQLAYGAESQYIKLKSQAMSLWTDAILDEYDKQKEPKK